VEDFVSIVYLRTPAQEDGVALLKRCDAEGYVLPGRNRWVAILPSGDGLEIPDALLQANQGVLLHYFVAGEQGWRFAVYRQAVPLILYGTEAETSCNVDLLLELVGSVPANRATLQAMLNHPTRMPAAEVVAEALGLPFYDALSQFDFMHESLDRYPEFRGVISCTRANQPRGKLVASPTWRHFPAGLCGTAQQTRKATRKLVQQAWKDGSWDAALRAAHYVDESEAELIVIGADRWFPDPDEEVWRMYWLADELMNVSGKSKEEVIKQGERCEQLILQGFRHFWFAIAMIERIPPVRLLERGLSFEDFGRACFLHFLEWLPEFQKLGDRIVNQEREVSYVEASDCPLWADPFLTLLRGQGWSRSHDDIKMLYGGDLVRAMLDEGIIRQVKDRYAFKEDWKP